MDALPFDLLDIVRTKEDKILVVSQLEAFSHAFFSQEIDVVSILEEKLSYRRKQKILGIAQKNKIAITDLQVFQSFIDTIKKTIQQMPEVAMTLAFEPTQDVIYTVSTWFSTHMEKAVILDISVDKTLVGGAIISFNGVYKDFSLKKKVEEKYMSKSL